MFLVVVLCASGFAAPFGTTILGAVSLRQIRRSAGRLCGLGLALFDALLYPLLVLDWFVGVFCIEFTMVLRQAGGHYGGGEPDWNVVAVLTVPIAAVVDFFVVRAAWRAVRRSVDEPQKQPGRPPAAPAPVDFPLQIALLKHHTALAYLGLALALVSFFALIAMLSIGRSVAWVNPDVIGFGALAVAIFAFILGLIGRKTLPGKITLGFSAAILLFFFSLLLIKDSGPAPAPPPWLKTQPEREYQRSRKASPLPERNSLEATSAADQIRPTYQLIIGEKTLDLPVHEDPKRIQDDLLSNIRPLWDGLKTGNSVAFRFQRGGPLRLGKDGEQAARAEFGEGLRTSATIKSPAWRFFKGRNGGNGLEQLDEGKEPDTLCWGPDFDWAVVEGYLRKQVLSIDRIRTDIQNGVGQIQRGMLMEQRTPGRDNRGARRRRPDQAVDPGGDGPVAAGLRHARQCHEHNQANRFPAAIVDRGSVVCEPAA